MISHHGSSGIQMNEMLENAQELTWDAENKIDSLFQYPYDGIKNEEDFRSKYHLSDGSQEMMNWKTCMRTHLVEGDASYWTQTSSVFFLRRSGKDSTIT
ncbi:hypothetical protein RND71_010289 [Anisodus tanguticus]|uniref:Uncharacterized protein n=1 Tax=Anisodus tanguticus TaxID=243964 RepID=A0AAE1SHH3_9SOLA|nr:hypothetical protein RND71_010289 [Anisodus tanguticus]